MKSREILLVEPPYRNKYPPMGLMKISTYFKNRGDNVRFYKGDLGTLAVDMLCEAFLKEAGQVKLAKYYKQIHSFIKSGTKVLLESIPSLEVENQELLKKYRKRFLGEDFIKFDIVAVTTLFTFYWKETISTIEFAKKLVAKKGRILVGGIASTILPEKLYEATGIRPIVGLLDTPGVIDKGDFTIIDNLALDYSILDEIDYKYPANDAYFGYMTRGCPNKCSFCAVPKLEPKFCHFNTIQQQLKDVDIKYGAKRNLLLMDNNVLASKNFNEIIDEIKDCGFGKGATYYPSDTYDILYQNIKSARKKANRGDIIKMLQIYEEITCKLSEKEKGDFYLSREENQLLYPVFATADNIILFDDIVRPLNNRFFKAHRRCRYVDFNQGIDARLITDEKMKKLSEIAIRPLRIAFDHCEMKDAYMKSVETAAKYGIKNLSNYLLYNYKDKPEDLYERMKINIDLCDDLNISIYSFPMKYHPIEDPEYFSNRNYIGTHWNRKFIRAIQAVLNATKGKIGKGKEFFEQAFGKDVDDFMRILWMPETFIIYRRKYDALLRLRLADKYSPDIGDENDLANEWWDDFRSLSDSKLKRAKDIIKNNDFKNIDTLTADKEILKVLKYYSITRKDSENGD